MDNGQRTTDQFAARLRAFSRARRGLLNAALGYRAGGAVAASVAVGLVLLAGWIPWPLVNLALFAALALLWLGAAGVYLVRRKRFRSDLDEAFRYESAAGGLDSRVISAWDFLTHGPDTPLTRAVVQDASQDLARAPESNLNRSDRDNTRWNFGILLAAAIAVSVTPWFAPSNAVETFRGSWSALMDLLFPLEFDVLPGEEKLIRRVGETVEVELVFRRRTVPRVKLIDKVGEETRTIDLDVGADGRARFALTGDVESEHALRFEIGDLASDGRTIVFALPPRLENMQTELAFPGYTRLLPRTLEGVQPRIMGLPGTRIALGFNFSKDIATATLTWDDGRVLPLETVGRFAAVSLMHNREGRATLDVRDIHGFSLEQPISFDFELQVDEKPQVALPRHFKDDMPLLEPDAKSFSFGVSATDDYGVTRVLLRWQKATVDNPNAVTERGEVERLVSPARAKAIVAFEKVFDGLQLVPGDKVSFTVEVQDNRSPDKQTTVSRRSSFFIYRADLAGLNIRELGFGEGAEAARNRIGKSTRATSVKEPEGLRRKEAVKNTFEAEVTTSTRAPTVRGEHGKAAREYFRLLSTLKDADPAGEVAPMPMPPPPGGN